MNDYQLIALDMDGTLLTNTGRILPETLEALEWAVSKGIAVTLTTGRSLQGIKKYKELLPLSVPIITYNGAMVVSLKGQILFQQTLEPETSLSILNLKKNPSTSVVCWCQNRLYVNEINPDTEKYAKLANTRLQVFEDPKELAEKGITKILWIDTPKNHILTKDRLKNMDLGKETHCTSKPEFLEFFHRDVSKGTALEHLCQYLKILPSKVIAFGDGENDIPLLQTAGLGIAMGNAAACVKEQAQWITSSNEENGIQKALFSIL